MTLKKLNAVKPGLNLIKTSGIFMTNTYIFEYKNRLHVVDPGKGIGDFVKEKVVVLLTHGHFDHILGLSELNIESVFVSLEDRELLQDPIANFSQFFNQPFVYEGKIENIDDYIETIKVPGHTIGSRIIRVNNYVFTGDTVFCNTIGRSDLGGSKKLMEETIRSLNGLFRKWSPDYVILPGHENICTLKELLKVNPFFKGV
ncbi:MBL fold metallo-hydrolase [Thermosipho ferrireducens]|uniref:MBL fold metallo-hydrolase n=1 Tax=Thermosipho ferrireducens TaxID=2571116 RepID=A0ABX7SA08_9BACT|nr:MBL fold metallo-hydrolase [Thermosipho ferrireducens]QTA38813.1 MBL fold metallo-hydrolase [Thermosipho ferrireducens]